MNEEGILVALKLGVTDAVKQQLSRILNNCDFEADELNAVMDIVLEWSEKYKLKIQKVPNKDTYYIVGRC